MTPSSIAEKWNDNFKCKIAFSGDCCNRCHEPTLEISGREAAEHLSQMTETGNTATCHSAIRHHCHRRDVSTYRAAPELPRVSAGCTKANSQLWELRSTFRGREVVHSWGVVMVSCTNRSVGTRVPALLHRFNPSAYAEQSPI